MMPSRMKGVRVTLSSFMSYVQLTPWKDISFRSTETQIPLNLSLALRLQDEMAVQDLACVPLYNHCKTHNTSENLLF